VDRKSPDFVEGCEITRFPPLDAPGPPSSDDTDRVLFERYVTRLTALARSRLSPALRRRLDPEDLVMSAFRSFFVGVRAGKWDRDGDLWSLLAMITLRKAARQARRHRASQRSIHRESSAPDDWQVADRGGPSAEEALVLTEQIESLIEATTGLDREILLLQLRGEEAESIAKSLEVSPRTVRRSLQRIRELVSADRTHQQLARSAADARSETLAEVLIGREPTRTLNDLTLHEMVGQGAVSKVFQATDHVTGQPVAVKFLRKSCWADTRAVRACLHELDVLARLKHLNLGAAVGWGRAASGAIFLVMEWIDGENLASWLIGRRSVDEVICIGRELAAGLAAAHAVGITHCDLKPQNILQDRSGRVRVIDFGLAHWPEADDSPLGGSAGYLAPEQISPAFGMITERTDVYGMGALLYALLTGAPPWGTDYASSLAGLLSPEPVTPLPDSIDDSLRQAVMTALHKNPADRWPNVGAMFSEVRIR
jgi:RNA polymerase sigma factor (sigma-70 family)